MFRNGENSRAQCGCWLTCSNIRARYSHAFYRCRWIHALETGRDTVGVLREIHEDAGIAFLERAAWKMQTIRRLSRRPVEHAPAHEIRYAPAEPGFHGLFAASANLAQRRGSRSVGNLGRFLTQPEKRQDGDDDDDQTDDVNDVVHAKSSS